MKLVIPFRIVTNIVIWLSVFSNVVVAQNSDTLRADSLQFSQQPNLNILEKKEYTNPKNLFFKALKKKIPQPFAKANPEYQAMYWYSWEKVCAEINAPSKESGLKYHFLKINNAEGISQWHNEMAVHYWKYGSRAFNAVQSLDNFYDLQQMDGYIANSINSKKGKYYTNRPKEYTVDPPLFTWAEWEWFKFTGDSLRVKRIAYPLMFQIEWLEQNRALPNEANNCYYWNLEGATGIEIIPRTRVANIDMVSQMAINYLYAEKLVKCTENKNYSEPYLERYGQIKSVANSDFYDSKRKIYADIDMKRKPNGPATIHSFWPLLAKFPEIKIKDQIVKLVFDKKKWNMNLPLPVIPQFDTAFSKGKDLVYGELDFMVVNGLQANGEKAKAKELTSQILNTLATSFKNSAKLFSIYNSNGQPSTNASSENLAGIPLLTINLFIEQILGIEVEGNKGLVNWNIDRLDEHGIKNLPVGHAVVSFEVGARKSASEVAVVKIKTNKPIIVNLRVGDRVLYQKLAKGTHKFKV